MRTCMHLLFFLWMYVTYICVLCTLHVYPFQLGHQASAYTSACAWVATCQCKAVCFWVGRERNRAKLISRSPTFEIYMKFFPNTLHLTWTGNRLGCLPCPSNSNSDSFTCVRRVRACQSEWKVLDRFECHARLCMPMHGSVCASEFEVCTYMLVHNVL